MMKETRFTLVVALLLIALGISLRLFPHPANFAPLAAIAIFGGATLPRKLALWVPLTAMVISDTIIGYYTMMPVTWACYGLIALASSYWLKKPTFMKGATLTLTASLFFFLVTNFAVWLTSGMYVHNWSGFVQCYTLAIPFFRNTAASDIVYTVALFGVLAFAKVMAQGWLKPAAREAQAVSQ